MPRIHPLKRNSKDHLRFSKKLEKIIKISKKNLIIKKIFINFYWICYRYKHSSNGRGKYHYTFASNDTLDVFTNKIWKNINVKVLNKGLFKYSIRKKIDYFS